MSKYLLIAEKPSLMKEIQACYNKHKKDVVDKLGAEIDFTALSGHVCTNFMPTDYAQWKDKAWADISYPMIPNDWKIKAIDDKNKQSTIEKIKNSLPKYKGIICATDSDTEGYGIYYLLEQYLEISLPTLRFMEHSLTENEILKSLLSMTDLHGDPKHINTTNSFLLRSRADWLFGMNASRVVTNKRGMLHKIGRVKSPTIKLVYDNSVAIENHQSKPYHVVVAQYQGFKGNLQGFKGNLQGFKGNPQGEKEDARFEDKKDIPSFPLEGRVIDIKAEKALRNPPKLFDLAAVQTEAGTKFKLKPDKTLEIIQALYQNHKVISYPRTQCRYISSEKAKELPKLLESARVFSDLDALINTITQKDIDRVSKDKNVVNDTEVNKESHDALLPTTIRPNLSKMSENEVKICHLIFSRLVMQFLGKEEGQKTVLKIQHGDGIFKSEGKIVHKKGWTVLYKEQKDVLLPVLNVGDEIKAEKINAEERKTKAPSRLSQATLINAMRNIATQITDPALKKSLAQSQGIGTPATRAAIIKDIIITGYVSEKKDGLYITDKGKAYIDSIKELDIVSPIFAAEMDTNIKKIQRGEIEFEVASKEVIDKLYEMINQVESLDGLFNGSGAKIELTEEMRCPVCDGKLTNERFSIDCQNACGFKVSKNILGHNITNEELLLILQGKKTKAIEFVNKEGKKFLACLLLDENNVLKFEFPTAPCPNCKERMKLNVHGAFCQCGLNIYRNQRGYELSYGDIKTLLMKRQVTIDKFRKKGESGKFDGDYYSGKLYIEKDKLKFSF